MTTEERKVLSECDVRFNYHQRDIDGVRESVKEMADSITRLNTEVLNKMGKLYLALFMIAVGIIGNIVVQLFKTGQ